MCTSHIQVLGSLMWLGATVLDSRGLEGLHPSSFQIFVYFVLRIYMPSYILLSFKNLMKNQIVIVDTSSLLFSLTSESHIRMKSKTYIKITIRHRI